ncbi:hypothetical protein ACFXDE_15745 [Kitasatospora sp. NPDC059408]|uniref:hypothetical protein n=1 Tax=Kitasatospora sp. NPDC059408 TaxID=3346823 RepID=UPI0036779615
MAGIGSMLRQGFGAQRTVNGSPGQTAGAEMSAAGVVEVTLPKERFDLIVRVTLSTHQENASWVRTAFTQRGWHCEPDTMVGPDVMGPAERVLDSHWSVDVPVAGSRAGAETDALLKVGRIAKSSGRLVDIRGAWTLSPKGVSAFEYRVYEKPPAGLSRLMQLVTGMETRVGLRDTKEVIRAYSDQHAEHEARRRATMCNGPERPENWGVRRSAVSSKTLPHSRQMLYSIRKSESDVVRMTFISLFEVMCVVTATPWWRHHVLGVVGLALFALLYCIPTTLVAARVFASSSRRKTFWCACGGSALAALLGVVLGLFRRQAGPIDTLVLVGVVMVGYGLYHLVRASSITKILLWATPVLISLAPPLAQQIGGLSNWTYLNQFEMGPSDVNLSAIAQMQPVARPLLVGIGSCLITAGVVGLLKRFHIDVGSIFLVPFLVMYSLVVVVAALDDGKHAGEKALRQATAFRLPSDYHGITPEVVCVYSIGGSLPVHGAMLPVRTPMLTFDSGAAHVALWNARTTQVTRVPGNDVSLIPATSMSGECPSVPGGPSTP